MYKRIIRPLLFLLPPETVHNMVFVILRLCSSLPGASALLRPFFSPAHPALRRTVFGIDFPNPVGLAAGLDKDCEAFEMLGAMGFGFIEVGTITPRPQPGNPKPRLFRLKRDQALINRMGFNGRGVEHAAARLANRSRRVIIGGNIGKNKATPNEEAAADYEKCFEDLFPVVDYFVVNVSSPNTPGLRELQDREPLTGLLRRLQELNGTKAAPKPILLKIAPDLTFPQIDEIIAIVQEAGIAGIVAANTTISREGLSYSEQEIEAFGEGGLSGRPLAARSTEIIRYISQKTGGAIPIIGVGGIMSAQDAVDKLEAGASLVQLYTGFIYEGPGLIANINKTLLVRGV